MCCVLEVKLENLYVMEWLVIFGYINQDIEYKCELNEFWDTCKSSEDDYHLVNDWDMIVI